MKEFLKTFLKQLHIYHPLQTFYRSIIEDVRIIYSRAAYSKYKGRGYTCNFCGSIYEKFIPEYPSPTIADAINKNEVIAGYGENVFCPYCRSKNRERLLLATMENRLDVSNKKILHFSPEKQLHAWLKTKAQVITADLEPGFYKNIDQTISQSDATCLRFADESFDIVIANHIMEHIPEDIKAMKEFYRVLKTGGFAILQVPFSEILPTTIEDPSIQNAEEQERLYGQKDHVRIYSLNNYIDRLKSAGFKTEILTVESLKQFSSNAIQEKEPVILGHK